MGWRVCPLLCAEWYNEARMSVCALWELLEPELAE